MLQDVFALMAERLKWEPEPEIQLHVFTPEDLSPQSTDHQQRFEAVCKSADVFLAVDMTSERKRFLESVREFQWPAFLVLDSEPVRVP
jgi:hypothetical protein